MKVVRGFKPDEVIDRKKIGIGAPVGDLYQSNLSENDYNLSKEFYENTCYLNLAEVETLLSSNQVSRTWALLALWYNYYALTSN